MQTIATLADLMTGDFDCGRVNIDDACRLAEAQLMMMAVARARARYTAGMEIDELAAGIVDARRVDSILRLDRYERRASSKARRALCRIIENRGG